MDWMVIGLILMGYMKALYAENIILIIVMVYLIREKLVLSYETAKQTKEWHMMTMSLQKIVHGSNIIADACKPLFFTMSRPNSHCDNNYDHCIMVIRIML